MEKHVLSNSDFVKKLEQEAEEYKALSVTQEYSRSLYEDKRAMDQCMDDTFGTKKVIVSDITGKKLHKKHSKADNQYGRKKATSHKAEPDHGDSLAKIHQRFQKQEFIGDKDIKEVGNRRSNLKVIPQDVNRSKRDASSIEALSKPKYSRETTRVGKVKEVVRGAKNQIETDILLKNRSIKRGAIVQTSEAVSNIAKSGDRMITLSDQMYSLASVEARNSASYFHSVAKSGLSGANSALQASLIPLITQGTTNLCRVASGDMTPQEAAKDIGGMAAKIAAGGAATDIGIKIISEAANNNSINCLQKLLSAEKVGQGIAIASMIANVTVKFANGEIDEKGVFLELTQKGASMALQNLLCNPVNGLLVASGPVAVTIVASMLISSACEYVIEVFKSFDDYKKDAVIINRIIREAELEIAKQKDNLKELCNAELNYIDEKVKNGIELILNGVIQRDGELATKGMNEILEITGETVIFTNSSEEEIKKAIFNRKY